MSAEIEGEVREVDEERAIVVRQPDRLAQAPTPEDTLSLATRMATALKDVVEKQKLFAVIQGKKYPQVEAWMTIARMDNVVAREARPPIRRDDGSYEAFVELIRLSDGMVVGAGSALCGTADDRPWATRGEPARRSMAVTRATSRAFRQQYCPAPDQLVLTADLRWVRADSLKAGDGIVGFDKELGPKMQYRRSVVVAAEPGRGDLYEIVTDLGSTVVSDGHPFVRLPSKRRAVWTNAVNLDVGDRLAFMVAPFGPDRTYEAGWMAGFLDGEGSVHPRLGVYVGQKAGAIADRLVADAHQLGFELRTHVRARSMVNFTVYGGMATWLTLLGRIRPLRLLAYSARLWEGRNAMRRRQVATVQSVRPLGRGAIVAIETSTETLIVDGFLSHNSWIMALAGYEPTPAEEMPRDDGPIAASTPPRARADARRRPHRDGRTRQGRRRLRAAPDPGRLRDGVPARVGPQVDQGDRAPAARRTARAREGRRARQDGQGLGPHLRRVVPAARRRQGRDVPGAHPRQDRGPRLRHPVARPGP
jgi:hypothetical protein